MLFYYVIFGIIGLCLVGIGIVVVSKFPQLALIDTEALPKERETKKKKQIIETRVRRVASEQSQRVFALLRPVGDRLRDAFQILHERLLFLDRKYREQKPAGKQPTAFEKRLQASKLIERATAMAGDEEKEGETEKLLVEAIGLDSKNLDAYRVLGDLYLRQKSYLQARETYEYLAKSSLRECCGRRIRGQQPRRVSLEAPCDAPAAHASAVAKNFVSLATACRQLGEEERAKAALEMAVAHDSSNPRTLDLLVEACILVGEKTRAGEVLARLKAVNPDNQKLGALEEKITGLPAESRPQQLTVNLPAMPSAAPSRNLEGSGNVEGV